MKTAYFELERSRDVYNLARQILPSSGQPRVKLASDTPDAGSSAQAEADLFRAELAYRQAYAKVTSLMTGR